MPMATADDELVDTWRRIAGSDHPSIEADLIGRHGEPHRRYHTAEHVRWVLRHVDDLLAVEHATSEATVDADAIRIAALFHDIVYDPRSSTNEADSAAIAVDACRAIGWPDARGEVVRDLILATAGHEADDLAAAVLLDADLAVLGGDPAAYAAYAAQVREEYGFVPDDAWVVGRAAVLRTFRDRDHVFATATMATAREAAARRNLTAELAALDGAAEH
ncbi:MAG: hypothetical protein JWM34_2755 [Ilumatobacteraceae bacterium]|nr:hypothetical protein [Ilumatobacteraceae bacterium]